MKNSRSLPINNFLGMNPYNLLVDTHINFIIINNNNIIKYKTNGLIYYKKWINYFHSIHPFYHALNEFILELFQKMENKFIHLVDINMDDFSYCPIICLNPKNKKIQICCYYGSYDDSREMKEINFGGILSNKFDIYYKDGSSNGASINEGSIFYINENRYIGNLYIRDWSIDENIIT